MNDSSPVTIICGTAILLAVLGGVFFLAYHGTLSSAEVFGLLTTIIGIAGGVFAVHSGVSAGGRAAARGAARATRTD